MEHVSPSTKRIEPHLPQEPYVEKVVPKKSLSAVELLRTLHLKAISTSTSIASDIAKSRIFVPVSIMGWLSCKTVNGIFKACAWMTKACVEGEKAYSLTREVQELTCDIIDSSQAVRDGRQSNVNAVATVAQVVPVVGTLVGIASSIAQKEAEAERAVTWWAKRYTQGVFSFIRYSAPAILQGLHTVCSTLEVATRKLQKAITNENLENIRDKAKAACWKILHDKAEDLPPRAPHNVKIVPVKEKEVRLIEPDKILSLVGPSVVSTGTFYNGAAQVGKAAASVIESLRSASNALFETIGASNLSKWLAKGANGAASGLEIAMILPYGKQVTASFLEQAGLPVYAVEQTFAKLPETVVKHAVTLEGKALEAIRSLDNAIAKDPNSIKEYTKQLGLDHDTPELLSKVDPASWRGWFQSGLQALGDTRIGRGVGHLKAAISPKTREHLDNWQESAQKLAEAKQHADGAKLSYAAVVEVGGLWGALMQAASSNDAFTRFLRDTYINNVRPTLDKALTALESVHQINAASYNFLSAQMDANLQTELQLQQFLAEKAKIATNLTEQEKAGIVATATSWGLPVLSWLFLSTQTLTVLPFLLQRVVPHVLRASAEQVEQNSRPFWFFIAHNASEALSNGAHEVKRGSEGIGSWLQQTFNRQIAKVTGSYYIDPLRIENFLKLSDVEQQYIYRQTGAKDVASALKALDSMQELTFTLSDFFKLSSEQQEEIIFSVVHADCYKRFMADNPAYKKMTFSDTELARLKRAKSSAQNDQVEVPAGWAFKQYQALEHTTNHRLKNVLTLYNSLQPHEKAIMTPAKLKALTQEKLEHLLAIIDTYHPDYADSFKREHKVDISKIFTTQHRLEKETIYSALASIYNLLTKGQQAKLLEMTEAEVQALPNTIKAELILFLRHSINFQEGDSIASAFNSLDRMQQAEWREKNELAEKQREAVLVALEKEIQDVKLKLKAVKKRIARLTDSHYLVSKDEAAKQTTLQKELLRDKAAQEAALASMKEAQGPVASIKKMERDLAAKLCALKASQKAVDAANEKLTGISTKLSHLHELEDEETQKLASLKALRGDTMPSSDDVTEESPKLARAIDAALSKTLEEVGKSIIQSLVAVIKEKESPQAYKQAISFSREFLEEAIKLRQNNLAATEARIKTLKSEIAHLTKQKAYKELAEKQLQLRAHVNFTLKLNQALLAKFKQLRTTFETHHPQPLVQAAPAA